MGHGHEPSGSTPRLATGPSAAWLADLVQPVVEELTAVQEDGSFVRTGFTDLDDLTRGVRGGELWVLTGRSGVGKSVLARGLARFCAVAQRRRALYVSRCDRVVAVAARLILAEASVPLHHAQTGRMTDSGWARLARAGADLGDVPLEVVPALDVAAVSAHLSAAHGDDRGPVQLLVVDDVPAGPGLLARLTAIRELAEAWHVAIVAVVQEDAQDLNRQQRSVDQVAEIALHLHRDDQGDAESARAGEADLIVRRNHRGPTTRLVLEFRGHYGVFVEPSKRGAR